MNAAQPRNAIVYNLEFAKKSRSVITQLLHCIRLIHQSYQRVAQNRLDPESKALLNENLLSLQLTEAFLEKPLKQALQIAVIGPTQSGKSSLVNLLLGQDSAHVSPLAGFTIHPQGFPVNANQLNWLNDYFHGLECFNPDELPKDRFDCYALGTPLLEPKHALPPCVIWDTPDFDSVTAKDYIQSVVRTAALADVLILMVSKDKYADQSVWQMMKLLEPLAQPTLICLNKVDADSKQTLIHSLSQKWQETRSDSADGIIAFNYSEDKNLHEQNELFKHLTQLIRQAESKDPVQRAQHLIETHIRSWVQPIQSELDAQNEWQAIIETSIQEALDIYQRDFLNHPVHYETFQRALAELLTLLEIPGLAGTLLAARKVVTWPIKQLGKLGRRSNKEISQEKEALKQTVEHLYIALSETLRIQSEKNQTLRPWWEEMAQLLRKDRKQESERCIVAIESYHQAFKFEIEQTAQSLYKHLQEHPAMLNSLRATRITADAAALALALHTGGLGIQDFIIAPAILSITSLLTESALGRFLHKAKAELKQRQIDQVEHLFKQTIGDSLMKLPEKLDAAGKFNLSKDTLQELEALLK